MQNSSLCANPHWFRIQNHTDATLLNNINNNIVHDSSTHPQATKLNQCNDNDTILHTPPIHYSINHTISSKYNNIIVQNYY